MTRGHGSNCIASVKNKAWATVKYDFYLNLDFLKSNLLLRYCVFL